MQKKNSSKIDFKKVSDAELLNATTRVVAEERMKTLEVIAHLEEIYARRLHLKKGYGSFQAFLVGEKLYNEGCAHRRVSAMKLVQDVPEARAALADGRLSLSTAAVVQNFFNTERLDHKKTYSSEEKTVILEKVARSSVAQCAQVLAKVSPTYLVDNPKIKIEDTAEIRALLEEFRVLSMSVSDSPQVLIKSALKAAIETLREKEKKAAAVYSKPSLAKVDDALVKIRRAPLKPASRYTPKALERQVWQNANHHCSYVAANGKRCASAHKLEIDHIIPLWLGGQTTLENLRLLCRAHHGLYTHQVFGSPLDSMQRPD